jgi:outer membrane autotransporter protein
VFQVGLYGSTKFGALSLAAGAGWTTGRAEGTRAIPVLGVNEVTSRYNLQGFSGRFEAAYAVASFSGVTASPYTAFQASSIRTSAFTEKNALTGTAFGIAANASTNVTARTELGIKLETSGQLGAMPATAFVRAGWGLYTNRDSAMTAQLVGLPGSFFTSTGLRPDRNVALIAAGGEVQITPALTFGGRVDAELGTRTNTLAGTANLRWAF